MNSTSRKVLLVCALVAVFALGVVTGQNRFGQPKSIIHVITVKWKADSTAEQRQKAIDGVKQMASAVPGIKNVWLKTLRVQGPSQDKPYDAAIAIEFESEAAVKAYADHPAHAKWYEIYTPIREESRSHQITN
ncbi:MAG: Dabb family protein [Blastocatellales bacterium]